MHVDNCVVDVRNTEWECVVMKGRVSVDVLPLRFAEAV
jgi:hypothetical protein